MTVGLWPYNVDVTPDGKLALTADNGNSGAADGQVDTVSVIDLEADAAARDRQGRGRRRARGLRDQPDRQVRGRAAPARQQRGQERVLLQPQRQRRRAEDRRQEGHTQPTRSRSAACPKARCSATTAATSTSATSSTRTSPSCASTATSWSTPASASRCRAIRRRCGVGLAERSRAASRGAGSAPVRGRLSTPSASER